MKYEAALKRVLRNLNESQIEIFEDLRLDVGDERIDEALSRLRIKSYVDGRDVFLIELSEEEYDSFSKDWKNSLVNGFAVEFFTQLFKDRRDLSTTTKGWLNQMAMWYYPGYLGKAIDLFDKVFAGHGLMVDKAKSYYMGLLEKIYGKTPKSR